MIKTTAGSMFIYLVLLSAGFFRWLSTDAALSCVTGGAFMLLNLLGLFILWKLIFYKKSIALAVLVIIFKYSILGYFLWFLPKIQWLHPVAFVVGISTLIPGILTAVLSKNILNQSL